MSYGHPAKSHSRPAQRQPAQRQASIDRLIRDFEIADAILNGDDDLPPGPNYDDEKLARKVNRYRDFERLPR